MEHVWVIEVKITYSKDNRNRWRPMFGHLCFGTREQAREEARKLYKENRYNWRYVKADYLFIPIVKYRATKYIRG
jgi:hypothetical protein